MGPMASCSFWRHLRNHTIQDSVLEWMPELWKSELSVQFRSCDSSPRQQDFYKWNKRILPQRLVWGKEFQKATHICSHPFSGKGVEMKDRHPPLLHTSTHSSTFLRVKPKKTNAAKTPSGTVAQPGALSSWSDPAGLTQGALSIQGCPITKTAQGKEETVLCLGTEGKEQSR